MRAALASCLALALMNGCGTIDRRPVPPPVPLEALLNTDDFEEPPPDPAFEAAQRERATVEDLQRELLAVAIATPAEIEAAGLRAIDDTAAGRLERILATLREGLPDSTYLLFFDPRREPEPGSVLHGREGAPLVALQRIDRRVPTCTTWVATDLSPSEDLAAFGGRIGTATEGICGGIAVMHSYLRLGSVLREQVIDGDHFTELPLRKVQGRDRKRMSFPTLIQRHGRGGASVCRLPTGGFRTSDRAALARFNRELSGFVNDGDRTWDCSLYVRTSQRGRDVLAHIEHVTSVTRSSGRTMITTVNGFDQGNQTDRVPVRPGNNTWTSRPGDTPPFSLTASTGRNADDLVRSVPNVGLVSYLCCRRP